MQLIRSNLFTRPPLSVPLRKAERHGTGPPLTINETALPHAHPPVGVIVIPRVAVVLVRQPDTPRTPLATPARFLGRAQDRTAYPPVLCASGAIDTKSASAPPNPSGTEVPRDAKGTSEGVSSIPTESCYAPTGSAHRDAAAPAQIMCTSAPGADEKLMVLRLVLARRSSEALSPYNPEAWEHLLGVHKLLYKYPLLPSNLRTGFDAGIPHITVTNTPANSPSLHVHSQAYLDIIKREFDSQRYLGPLSRVEVESLIGPFQTSPLSLVPKPGKPNKFRAVHNFSFPRAASASFRSINYQIDSSLFPCTWGTFPTICATIWHLPPDSQASIRDVAEAYRSVPITPSQWPGLVVKLRDHDSFAINTNDNFGLASAGGIYGIVGDAGTDIFRAEGIGPISKWVDDHIFFRIPLASLDRYNEQRKKWNEIIASNGGRLQDRGRFWYRGETMPNGFPIEFDEDAVFPIHDLSRNSPRSTLDAAYTYASVDIDHISRTLGIPWEPSKTVDFDSNVQYLGFIWDLQERTVSVPTVKKEKYLQAIRDWQAQPTHTLAEVQKLHGKLLHVSLIVPAGRAYLTRLEAMLGTFNSRPFTPHHAPTGTDHDLEWWTRTLAHPCVSHRIPGPPTRMPAPESASASPSVTVGEHGGWYPDGTATGETSGGQKPSVSSSSYTRSLPSATKAMNLRFSETTAVWLKGGGKAGVATVPPTMSSNASTPSSLNKAASSTLATYPANSTQQINLREASTMRTAYSFQPYPSPTLSAPSCSTSTRLSIHASYAIDYAVALRNPDQNPPPTFQPRRSDNVLNVSSNPQAKSSYPMQQTGRGGQLIRTRYIQLPRTLRRGEPAAYHPSLTPQPSLLRPHCFAGERLRLWKPESPTAPSGIVDQEDIDRVIATMALGFAEGTKESYGSGLLAWHVWCDSKGVPEHERAPASQLLISAFISSLTGAFAGKTIRNYVYGLRAWHVVHSMRWRPNDDELDLLLKAADKLTPETSKRKKRQPYTIPFILQLREQMVPDDPFDTAVFACLVCLFYSASRVGEFTVRRLNAFDPAIHPSKHSLRRDQDRNGRKVTVLHIPRTKTSVVGEDVYWSAQNGPSDPEAALDRHLDLNQPPEGQHLFAYRHKGGHRPLTKTAFVKRLAALARSAGLDPLQGHGIRIGATLEYLLRGVSFEVMKVMGRWQSDAFTLYLRKHALILAPYIQAQAPQVYDDFVRITMPSGVR
ncbi:hypothetical protein D9615_003418 [Tricholomella constricta]|uniref:Tyr recombinase domain-containing protein n=1 Tax=Tricholomella constricta TaxID=117010 RepID=A0A8H5HJ33_9AGAR|nr:hypothetical protein D9615_003418 [Tricholomella constricta]